MSADHKAALAAGRQAGSAVRRYLEAIESTKPKRGRKASPETLQRQLAEVRSQLPLADPLARLHLMQRESELDNKLTALQSEVDLGSLEKEFVKVAAAYGESKGISAATWKRAGIPADVLKRAGIN